MAPTTSVDLAIQALLDDPENFIPNEEWFSLLQCDGTTLSPDEAAVMKDPKARKRMHIRNGDKFHAKIYRLSKRLLDLYSSKNASIFGRLPKNSSDAIHAIGKMIVHSRYTKARVDVHPNTESEFIQFLTYEKYAERESFYFLSQRVILQFALEKWSHLSIEAQMEYTDCDRLRVIGVMFDNEMRSYIPYTLSEKPGDAGRETIDEWRSKRKTAFHLLTQKFIDMEVSVKLPEKWNCPETIEKIDCSLGVGTYDSLEFDPNRKERIDLPWTVKDITSLFRTTVMEYNKVMKVYTKGTGGGDGDPASYVCWQTRDESNFARYYRQVAQVYLTIIHIWDKSYGFVLTAQKEPVPLEFARDDADSEELSDDDGYGSGFTPRPEKKRKGRSSSSTERGRRSSSTERELASAIKSMTAARNNNTDILHSTLKEIVNTLKEDVSTNRSSSLSDVQASIRQTESDIEQYTQKMNRLKELKSSMLRDVDPMKRNKKESDYKMEMKRYKKLIKLSKAVLTAYEDQLQQMVGMKQGGESDSSEDS